MLTMHTPGTKRPHHLITIQGAMHMSVIAMGVIALLLTSGMPDDPMTAPPTSTTPWMPPLMMGVALILAVLVIVLPKLIPLQPAPDQTDYQRMLTDAPTTTSAWLDYAHSTPRLHTLTILRLALAESIAVIGWVMALLMANALLYIPFAALALLLQVVFGPIVGFVRSNRPISSKCL